MVTTVRVDGWPVAPGTAAAFLNRLKPAFERQFPGITLHVYSGYRSYEDQVKIFLDRYVTRDQVNGRTVYDERVWNGVRYYRISGEGTVAQPGTSNHMSGAALDIRDSGTDAGVTTAGNPRATWIRLHAAEYGFNPIGYTFGEPWHIEYTGSPWEGGSAAGGGSADDNKEDSMATDDSNTWTGQRIGGSTKGASITDLLRDILKNQATIIAQNEWLKNRTGGTDKSTSITDMLRGLSKK